MQSKAFPEISTKPPRPGLLDTWHEWLERQRINGNHNARQLWQEMVDAGFAGSETTVRDAVSKWRKQSNAPSVSRVDFLCIPGQSLVNALANDQR
jgi:Tfp pilus assembly protein PilX